MGSDVWDKVPNKSVFLTPSLKVVRSADRHHVDYGPSPQFVLIFHSKYDVASVPAQLLRGLPHLLDLCHRPGRRGGSSILKITGWRR